MLSVHLSVVGRAATFSQHLTWMLWLFLFVELLLPHACTWERNFPWYQYEGRPSYILPHTWFTKEMMPWVVVIYQLVFLHVTHPVSCPSFITMMALDELTSSKNNLPLTWSNKNILFVPMSFLTSQGFYCKNNSAVPESIALLERLALTKWLFSCCAFISIKCEHSEMFTHGLSVWQCSS